MFKKTLQVGVLSILLMACQSKNPEINYKILHEVEEGIAQLNIYMTFPADTSGVTILEFPDATWGQTDLYNSLHNIEILDAEGTIEKNKDSGWIVLNHAKGIQTMTVQYQLRQDFEDKVSSRKVYRPIITPEYFHVFSHNLFMIPKNMGASFNVRLDWENQDEGFIVHNSFGSKQTAQLLEGVEKDDFGSAIFVGGDFEVLTDAIKGNQISLATRGDWVPFEPELVMEVLKQTLTCQRNFWNDHSQEYFTVTLQPFPQEDGSSFQGTGLTNSFATSVSNNAHTSINQMVYLFNHELMHNWIGGIIQNSNEEEQYWFSEGFTEYYTFKNVAKNKINGLSASFYLDELNRAIKNLFSSPVMGAPNEAINYENFWSDANYSKLPYYRGAIFAFYLDQEIQLRSDGAKSLDDVMHKIFADARVLDQKITHEYFVSQLEPYWGEDFQAFFDTHILEGEVLPLSEWFKKLELDYESEGDIFHLGFKFDDDNETIAHVDQDSNAWKAGLRAGDKRVSQSIWYGQTGIPVSIGVQRHGQTLDFEYLPVKKAEVPQLRITENNLEKLGF